MSRSTNLSSRAADNVAARRSAAGQIVQTDLATRQLRALVICGPTSSGKSDIALRVAELVDGEIINADSRQVYRGMNTGTGMPSRQAFARVPHHLYAFLAPALRYSAAQFVEDAQVAIRDICGRSRLPIIVGGTGFYIEALIGTMPLDRPPADEALRIRLRKEAELHSPEVLWAWLAAIRPESANKTRRQDSYRILRALESALSYRGQSATQRAVSAPDVDFVVTVLRVSRSALRSRIAQRVRQMFDEGLVCEAQTVRTANADVPALSGLGYAEALAVCDGLATQEEAIAATTRRTRQYAKRQETWFRRLRNAVPIEADDRDIGAASIIALARKLRARK